MNLSPSRRERAFQEATNWSGFLETMAVNRPTIEANYAGCELTDADKREIEKWPVTDVLVLAHDWCGDVVANLPFFARVAAETGKLRLHIVPKDPGNGDIGALYPHADGEVHIPIYVFFDAAGRELGHLIERTPELDALVRKWIGGFLVAHPLAPGAKFEFSALPPEQRGELIALLNTERPKVRELEKRSLIDEVTRILAQGVVS